MHRRVRYGSNGSEWLALEVECSSRSLQIYAKKENIIRMHIHMYIYGFYLFLLMLYLRICLERGGRNEEISAGFTMVTMVEGDRDRDTLGTKREAKG